MLGPVMDDIKKSYSSNKNIQFKVIDIDEEPDRARAAGVMSIPLVVIYRNGMEVSRFVGVQSRSTYVGAINDTLRYE
jgi:thioredoxin 1